MANKRVLESLERATSQHRIVFWYDPQREWEEEVSEFDVPGVEKLEVRGTEFGTKVRIAHQRGPEQRFLLYFLSARPVRDSDNWLLDLLLQGHEFRADKASLALQEVGLAYEFKELAEKHLAFFASAKRTQALKELLHKDDRQPDVRLKMMAVLAGQKAVEVEALLLHFLRQAADDRDTDPVDETFGACVLVEPFWKEVSRLFGFASPTPSLKGFAVFLFSAANPLDGKVVLRPHVKVFLQRWKDSRDNMTAFEAWSDALARELHVTNALERLDKQGDVSVLEDADVFEAFDKAVILHLCKAFAANAPAAKLRETILTRRGSFWNAKHEHGYKALEQAVQLRELLASAELTVESIDAGLRAYTGGWWRIDTAYRRCIWHLRKYGQPGVMAQVSNWIEKAYLCNYLQPLTDRWGDKVVELETWGSELLLHQRQFFSEYVQPFLSRNQKVFVIISDALRYEAAEDFAAQLNVENRWSAETKALLGSLPSYTQLGMAALLPGKGLAVDPETSLTSLGDTAAGGTANRADILLTACGGRGTAIQASEFLELNSKANGRELFEANDVIYIYHNKIDKVGDALATEHDAFNAVDDTFDELRQILKKVTAINGSNMVLTADHGFLFQQDEVADADATPLPPSTTWGYQSRRFAFNPVAVHDPRVKTFSAAQLGLQGDWHVTFPRSLGRFPLRGSGKRFVHGGFSLQEVVVPVVRIRKARSDDVEQVEVDLMRVPQRITTGKTSFSLYQDRPVGGKVQGRIVRIGIYAQDGTALSDTVTQVFDQADADARNREVTIVLTMSAHADKYNNQDLEIRLDVPVAKTDGFAPYRQRTVRLHKPFASDFDD